MSMNAIAQAALKNHELVYAYHQGQDDYSYKDIGPWGNVRNGYCAALTFQWCQARMNGGDLAFDDKTHMAEKADWRVTQIHNLSKSDMLGYDETMKELSLVREAGVNIAGAPDAVRITNQVEKDKGLYFVQYKRDKGGHISAVEVETRHYHYFDANHGHFILKDKARFAIWYAKFLSDSGYDNRYKKKTIVTRVNKLMKGSVADLAKLFGG